MKRFVNCFCFSLVLLASVSAWAQDDFRVIVLKSGETVNIEGDIEVFVDIVQFRKDGILVELALDKVNLEETDRRNRELANKVPNSDASGGNTLADQVEAWKRSGGDVKKPEIIIGKPKSSQSQEDMETLILRLAEQLAKGDVSEIQAAIEAMSDTARYIFLGLVIVAGLIGLAGFIAQIYVVFTAMGHSRGMGVTLILSFLGYYGCSFVGSVTGNLLFAGISLLSWLVLNIGLLVHIFKDRLGSRLKWFTLVFIAPILAGAMLVGGVFYLFFSAISSP